MRTPSLRVGAVTVPAFRVFALTGLGTGIALSLAVSRAPLPQLVAVLAGLLTCLGALCIRVAMTRQGDLVWSEHEAAVLAATLVVGLTTGHVWELLDAVAVGLTAMLAIGRVGCLLAGCCHGRPARRGITYTPAHDLPARFTNVPLFPVQLVESVWAVLLTVIGVVLIGASAPGITCLIVLGAQAAGRFVLEGWRGDEGRGTGWFTHPRRWALGILITMAGVWIVAPQ
jgi:hypothetical protein